MSGDDGTVFHLPQSGFHLFFLHLMFKLIICDRLAGTLTDH